MARPFPVELQRFSQAIIAPQVLIPHKQPRMRCLSRIYRTRPLEICHVKQG